MSERKARRPHWWEWATAAVILAGGGVVIGVAAAGYSPRSKPSGVVPLNVSFDGTPTAAELDYCDTLAGYRVIRTLGHWSCTNI